MHIKKINMNWIREINNWFFIKKTIKKEKEKGDKWNMFNLRSNWYGRIYTVISLKEEDLGEEDMMQKLKAMERMRPINEYLESLYFSEIVYPSIEKIPESLSYLIVYSPIFNSFTFNNIINWSCISIVSIISICIGIKFML